MKRTTKIIVSALLCVCLVASFCATLIGCKDKEGVGRYSYNTSLSVFPTNWNPHIYQTDTDSIVQNYTASGFYTFDYNATKDGYVVVPDMATGDPIDVSADYVGSEWGIDDGETARAWEIPLRKDLKWENGEAITAQSFVNSLQLLLQPETYNYRANTVYQGNFVITNAKDYMYGGTHAYLDNMISGDEDYVDMTEFKYNAETGVAEANGHDYAVKFGSTTTWDSSNSLTTYYNSGYNLYFYDKLVVEGEGEEAAWVPAEDAKDMYVEMKKNEGKDGEIVLTKAYIEFLQDLVARMHGFMTVEEYAAEAGDYAYVEWQELAFVGKDYDAVDFDTVGIKALDNGNLVIILEKPLSGFYLKYNLSSTWLVNEKLYKSCEKWTDGVYSNSYGTSASTYMSYGPYKLTAFQMDKNIAFEKNSNWYGYNDEANKNLYQTTNINITYISGEDTRRNAFLKGEIDEYGLTASDMEKYSTSSSIYYTAGESTFFMALNPNSSVYTSTKDGKANASKAILNVLEFRQALSFATDRAQFALATSPTNSAAYGVFSSLIISDPETGTAYRTTEEAKDVLLDFWGLADDVGEGKKYATKDDAIASITGYDLAQAKEKFNAAYEKAIKDKLMDPEDTIEITIGTPSATSSFYNGGYNFFVNAFTEAVKGTKLEGKLTFKLDSTLGNDFATALQTNSVDMLFGVGWIGSALDPYYLLSAYTDPSMQYDKGWDTKSAMVDISFEGLTDRTDLNGKTVRMSLYDWTMKVIMGEACTGTVINADGTDGEKVSIEAGTTAENALRLKILAACEGALLMRYDMIPLIDNNSASLKGYKINYYTENYVYGVGRGGVKYMTYNFDDADWAKYVKDNGGTLNYEK